MSATSESVTVLPANEASCEDLQAVLGTRGPSSRCFCQRSKLAHRETFAGTAPEERAERMRAQTRAGEPDAEATSGLVAYLDGEPVGWCAVEPRPAYTGLVRNSQRVPWLGRDEDRTDAGVWAVTCFVTRAGYRRRGVAHALARAAVDFARDRGAHALEGYPILTTAVISEELHVGTASMFAAAGFTEVSRPTPRRAVVRIDF
ncbi:GNAT family N-acetyltransferase [Georgenia sp. MJ206]|uniref:GNAT family N-acetyltransferase n=1 Tax=Georgenia wangjunii TaxID=3117730 RepID=UPI002F2674BC